MPTDPCSEKRELVVVDDQLATLAVATTATVLAGGSLVATTTATAAAGTTTGTSAVAGLEVVVVALEAEQLDALASGLGVHVLASELLGLGLGTVLLLGVLLNFLLVELLVLAALSCLEQALGVGLLLLEVVVEGESNLFLLLGLLHDNRLLLGLLSLLLGVLLGSGGLTLGLALLALSDLLRLGLLLLAPATLAVATLALVALAAAGARLAVEGMTLLTGLTGEALTLATALSTLDLSLTFLGGAGSSWASTTTATAAGLGATSTGVVLALALSHDLALVGGGLEGLTGVIDGLLGGNGLLGNLHDDLLLLLGSLHLLLLGLLRGSGSAFLVLSGEVRESVSEHTLRLRLQRPAVGIKSLSSIPLYQLRTSAMESGSRSWLASKTAILTLQPAVLLLHNTVSLRGLLPRI